MEGGLEEAHGLYTVNDLVKMFEDAEEATYYARQYAERDRDYYDNIQLTAEEKAALKKRGQPETISNRIKRKVDFLVGMEKQQRVDPIARPNTPMHEQDAEGASMALSFVADHEDYDAKRSRVWRNMLVEGMGGAQVTVRPKGGAYAFAEPEYEIVITRTAWDRIFYDPHSSEADFSDAQYLGLVRWLDFDEALREYPDGEDILEATFKHSPQSDTYDDKPKFRLWSDKTRRRVRIAQIWIKHGEDWHYADYTRGGILDGGPSPYTNEAGNADCPLIFQSAYVNRENERYGIVREMISPQDEINRRRSKSLHLLNTSQVIYEDGATVDGIERVRKEAARPDGVIRLAPGGSERFRFETRTDLAASQFQLLQEAKSEIDLMGPNAAMLGDQGDGSASGKAIIASQQGGMVEMGDLLDSLRHFDVRVFRAIWNRVRQFWTAERWIRVTDDQRNLKWVGLNVPGYGPNVAELDVDITVEDAPDGVTPQLEQFEMLMRVAENRPDIPTDLIIEMMPNLHNKQAILERLPGNAPNPQAQMQAELQMRGAQAEIAATEAQAIERQANAAKTMQDARLAPVKVAQEAAQRLPL